MYTGDDGRGQAAADSFLKKGKKDVPIGKDDIIPCPFCEKDNIFCLFWDEPNYPQMKASSKTCVHFKKIHFDDALDQVYAQFEQDPSGLVNLGPGREPTKPRLINLQPGPGKIVVKPDESDRLINGIWVVRSARQSIGQVVAVYEDFTDPDSDANIEPWLQVGDWVIYGQHSGVDVSLGRAEKYVVLRESEVLCKVVEELSSDVRAV